MKKKILITGSSGFIGKHFYSLVNSKNLYEIHLAVRSPAYPKNQNCFEHVLGDFSESPNWGPILKGVDVVIHIAGLAHSKEKNSKRLEFLHYKNNYHATNLLIEAASKSGVKKFIFLSSIGVNGDSSGDNKFKFSDVANPVDIYSRSKFLSEQRLIKTCSTGKMNYVIIRPPIVYGPSAPGNIRFLLKLIKYIKFFPTLDCENKRSLLYVGNLSDLFLSCIENIGADNKTFLVSDDLDLTISEVVKLIADGNKIKVYIFSVPIKILFFILRTTFLEKKFKKFLNPLQIDIEHTKLMLNWRPPYSPIQKLQEIR